MWSKKYYFIKQGLYKLKANKKEESKVEIAYIAEVGFSDAPNSYLLPLFSSFNFDFSFLILPNIISNNIVIFFL